MSAASRPRCPACRQRLPEPLPGGGTPTERWPHFPFCSERCRLVDLGRWLDGAYVIPGPEVDPADVPPDVPRRFVPEEQ